MIIFHLKFDVSITLLVNVVCNDILPTLVYSNYNSKLRS